VERVQAGGWKLFVDVPKTKAFYAQMNYQSEVMPWLNYIQVSGFADMKVQTFFDLFGIDILKPSQLSYHTVENGSMMMYTGSYHLYGERLEGELDGWDIAEGGYCFSMTRQMEAVPDGMTGEIVEISFEAVLPWVLELPISAG
jgi:hypothetical protein